MLEYIAQVGPMLVLAGFTAETVSRAGGYGLILDMILGVVGSLLVGGITWVLVSHEAGVLAMYAIGAAGAGLAVVGQRRRWRSARVGR